MSFSKLQMAGGAIAILFVLLISLAATGNMPGANKHKDFAQCLSEKGAVMYGAFWCAHCKSQKQDFGKAFSYVNYIECSSPDGRSQTRVCTSANITGYPTWEFADGSREGGRVAMGKLAEKTGCVFTE